MKDFATYEKLRDALRIDKYALDNALMEQPDLYFLISEQYALAKAARSRALVAAKSRLEGRGGRVTKVAVDADDEVIRLQLDVDKWDGLKTAAEQRSHALRDLTQLYNGNYFQRSSGARAQATERRADDVREQAGKLRRQRPSGKE